MQRQFDTILSGILDDLSPGHPGIFSERPLVLLAVSGGIDSMCMAELFRNSAAGVRFSVAHCNFSLRGEESDSDERLVCQWAESHGIGLYRKRFDTAAYAEEKGLSIEMAARELRYMWFSDLCREYGYLALAVAHNANDNVETLFLNLLRGTGIKGLAGMRRISPIPVPGKAETSCRSDAALIRPLLGFTRKQIEGYVFSHRIEYHVDRTNAGTEYKRNRLRNIVFPVLEEINPSFIRTVGRDMDCFAQVDRIADDYYKHNLDWLSCRRISLGKLLSDPNWEYLLYRVLDGYGFQPAAAASVTALLKSGRTIGGKVFRSDRYVAVTSSKELIILDAGDMEHACGGESRLRYRRHGTLPYPVQDAFADRGETVTVHGPGSYSFNDMGFSVEIMHREELGSLKMPPGVLVMDSSRMTFPFICRKWESGDWFIPFGMKGRKKVSDLFTDLKYSLVEKSGAVMLVDGKDVGGEHRNHVSAILGVRIDNGKRVRDDTAEVMMIKVR